MTVRAAGQPDGAEIVLRFVWRAPRPGIKDAKTGELSRESAEDVPPRSALRSNAPSSSKDEAQIMRGTWRAEVWNGRRRLAMRRFAVQ